MEKLQKKLLSQQKGSTNLLVTVSILSLIVVVALPAIIDVANNIHVNNKTLCLTTIDPYNSTGTKLDYKTIAKSSGNEGCGTKMKTMVEANANIEEGEVGIGVGVAPGGIKGGGGGGKGLGK